MVPPSWSTDPSERVSAHTSGLCELEANVGWRPLGSTPIIPAVSPAQRQNIEESNKRGHLSGLMTTSLKNKWALVTGASRGVGRQISLALAAEGCRLILHSRALEHTKELVGALESQTRVHAVAAELSDEDAVQRLIDEALELSGGIDIVYNNAAIMTPWTEAHTTGPHDYRSSFEVNVIALVRICDRLLPGMLQRKWGRIINVTSGIESIRELLPYSMSKAAVDRYVRDCAPSLEGTGVVMSLLDPGWLRTDLGGSQAPNAVETVLPGALVPAKLADDAPSGQFFNAQNYRLDR